MSRRCVAEESSWEPQDRGREYFPLAQSDSRNRDCIIALRRPDDSALSGGRMGPPAQTEAFAYQGCMAELAGPWSRAGAGPVARQWQHDPGFRIQRAY